MHPIIVTLMMLVTIVGMFSLSGALIALAGREPRTATAPAPRPVPAPNG
ncbi:hypothetical protein OCH239_16900 [Roseivivax halodurans JCM 10272]|uniref:Uncharacterized protein n=1 Tax=Roseivivax halodurans JCM 10272 TaxID=1449350 RepID=X7EI16_9RHOB|nr:hypothetical protein [Roseivivax halodurans]ETX15510.1 hypothetical protein OCH239_16900 [Roseivivax halodurans JCM 10272]